MQTGVYVDPNRGKVTIGDWSACWLEGQAHLKPSTHERYAGILREQLLPQWSAVRLIDVTHADVQAWVSRLAARGAALAADTGVRFGELAGLRVGRLDLLRRRAMIAESVTVVQGRGQVWGTPKSYEQREVPIPRFLINDLAEHVREEPR